MPVPITRRLALVAPLVLPVSGAWASSGIQARLRELESRSGGRFGVAVLDTATGGLVGNRIDERFAMCSTCKVLAVGCVLARVDRGEERLDRRITFTERELVSPFKATSPHVGPEGMTIAALCEAAITISDSTAVNLLFASFGGPAALTIYLRSLGDPVTRLDHMEPALNIVKPGEIHDTTSPAAMAGTLRQLLLGDALSDTSRALLTGWMIGAKDAATHRLRDGLPAGWRIANKPGTWEKIATNDIGVIWPPGRAPIVVTAYLGEVPGSVESQEAILADVARIVAAEA
ncbi:class A beta-lactamase [Beijerinckia indica]|uniref:Beta-lactamase n=1 Tax=Beijerinckia indica subsp. indica (strain ATCC 9039 / DSM 1715 / NCIMB 8712) TaxID=395963 RepID=B2IKN6_BEII9|nr:class A beta-lactamase [Beijerinckia indica]ACB95075.1 Beta-lactamase [Beijerinckia indica subsp. indica ATCC 9039]